MKSSSQRNEVVSCRGGKAPGIMFASIHMMEYFDGHFPDPQRSRTYVSKQDRMPCAWIMKKLMAAAGILAGIAFGVPAIAQAKPPISVIVKDTTSPYWQAVLAGARKAGQDLGVNVVELGAQSEPT
jgi:hypothetical protein